MKKIILLCLAILVIPSMVYAKILGRGIAQNTITSDNMSNSYCTSVVAVSNDPTTADGNTFINLVDNTSTFGTETGEDLYTVPVAMNASQLRVTAAGSVGSGSTDSYIIVLRDDAADTSLTCTLDTTDTSCTDTSNVASLAAGSKLTVKLETSTASTAADITEALVSFCLTQ